MNALRRPLTRAADFLMGLVAALVLEWTGDETDRARVRGAALEGEERPLEFVGPADMGGPVVYPSRVSPPRERIHMPECRVGERRGTGEGTT